MYMTKVAVILSRTMKLSNASVAKTSCSASLGMVFRNNFNFKIQLTDTPW
jgi:hypothetical protein